jgi:hypothetical protein
MNTSLSILYLNQLKKLINEEKEEHNLVEFLRDIVQYCKHYHGFTNIKILINKKGYKDVSFKHSSLSETIFHIFTLITRISSDNVKDAEIIIRGKFAQYTT